MKNSRQEKIIELIHTYEVDTQKMLVDLLEQNGIHATQATVSRDIKDLALIKVPAHNNNYKYALPEKASVVGGAQKFQQVLQHGIISIQTAGNLVVIRTYAGMANAVCAALDQVALPGVIGTIAGDDTIFMAVANEADEKKLIAKLIELKQ